MADQDTGPLPAKHTPMLFTCRVCGNPFPMMKSYLTAYRKKYGKDPMYCSTKCGGVGRANDAEARNVFNCERCGKETPRRKIRKAGTKYMRYYYNQRFCGKPCRNEWLKERAAERFKSGEIGRHVKRHGYVWLSIPANVSRTGEKMEMLEHRYVMEQHLGRPLTAEETVHHKNGQRDHNAIENLELFSSRHGPGQRVEDKISFAIDMIKTYPDFARKQGYVLTKIDS